MEDMSYAEWQGLFLATKGMSLVDVLVESLRNIRDNLRSASSGRIPPERIPNNFDGARKTNASSGTDGPS